jgi:hypothetical protein
VSRGSANQGTASPGPSVLVLHPPIIQPLPRYRAVQQTSGPLIALWRPVVTSDRLDPRGRPDAVIVPVCNAPSTGFPGRRLRAPPRHYPTRSCAACPGRSRPRCNRSVSGGSFWEQEGEGILMDVQGELVEDLLQVCDHIHPLLLQGVQHCSVARMAGDLLQRARQPRAQITGDLP